MNSLLFFIVGAPIALLSALVHAWAISVLWGWYLVPLLGVPNFWLGYTLVLVKVLLSSSGNLDKTKQREILEHKWEYLFRGVFTQANATFFVVLFGWIGTLLRGTAQ